MQQQLVLERGLQRLRKPAHLGRKSPFTPVQQDWLRSKFSRHVPTAQEMRIMLLPRAEADGILDAPPCEDKVARVVSAPFTECQNAKADLNALTSLDCQRK